MATCDSVGSASRDQESEECFAYECDACKQESQTAKATVYCPECEEYLCNSCESSHKKLKASRFHEVVPVTETEGKEKPKSHALSSALKNECGCSTKKETVIYCLDHQELICSTCKNVQHRKCQSETVEDMIGKASVSEEFAALTDKTNSLIEDALQLKEDHTTCIENLTKQNKAFQQRIHQLRKALNQWVDELVENTQSELQNRVEGVTHILNEQSAVISDTLQLLDKANQSIEDTQTLKSEKQMFVISKKLQHPIELYEKTLNELKRNINGCEVTFERNNELVYCQQNVERFGYFDIKGPMANAVGRKVFLRAQAEQLRAITLSNYDSRMLAFACTSRGEILIADSNNMLLHLDANLNIKNSIKATGSNYMYSLAPLDEEIFVAITHWGKEISYVAITPTLHISHSVKLEKECKTLATANHCIYLLTRSSGSESPLNLQILDKLGNLVNTLNNSEMDIPLLQSSYYRPYLALNPTGSKFFVTDTDKSTVICMSTSGKRVYSYKDPDMTSPKGIVVDEDDNALVCYEDSNNIHMIKSDGTRHKILLSEEDGLHSPDIIGYRVTDGLLFVGNSDKVSVFKMR